MSPHEVSQDSRRGDFGLSLAAAICLVTLAGCPPPSLIPGVAGRPAAVTPELDQIWSFGGGVWNVDWDDARDGTSSWLTGLAGNMSYGLGLGRHWDFQAGLRHEHGWVSFRYQPVGQVDDPFGAGGSRFDLSIEAGTAFSAKEIVFILAPYVPWSEAYLGLNVSIPSRRATPYLTYRYGGGTLRYRLDPDDTEADPVSEWLEREEIFLGIEIPISDDANSRLDIEIYYGRSPRDSPLGTEITHEMWGLNVIYRASFFD